MQPTTRFLGALAVSSLAFAASAFSASAFADDMYRNGEKLAPKQELVQNQGYEPDRFDPSLVDNVEASVALRPVMDGLVRYDTQGKVVPLGAESWDVSEDGKTWTFHLRKQAKWQDGTPVVAGDYVYSWRRLVDPKTASTYAGYLAQANVVGAQEASEGKAAPDTLGVKALDDYTLQVQLHKPTPWLLQMLTYPVLVPLNKTFMEQWAGKLAQAVQEGKFVGNGPYKFVKYTLGESLEFVKDPNYWDAQNVTMTKVKHVYVTDPNSAYYRYLSGELAATSVPRALKDKVLAERPNEVYSVRTPDTFYYLLNNDHMKKAERQALQLLVDQKFLTNTLSKRGEATSVFAPTYVADGQLQTQAEYFGWDKKQRTQAAVKLLQDAGYTTDKPLAVKYVYAKSTNNELFANALQAWFEKDTGGLVKFVRTPVEGRVYYDVLGNGQYDMAPLNWGVDYEHVSSHLNILRCHDLNNLVHYCNPEYDKLLQQAEDSPSAQERAELYAKANKLLQEDAPVVPVAWGEALGLVRPTLHGYSKVTTKRYVRDFYFVADDAGENKK